MNLKGILMTYSVIKWYDINYLILFTDRYCAGPYPFDTFYVLNINGRLQELYNQGKDYTNEK